MMPQPQSGTDDLGAIPLADAPVNSDSGQTSNDDLGAIPLEDQSIGGSSAGESQKTVLLQDKGVVVGYPESMNQDQVDNLVKERYYSIPIRVPQSIKDEMKQEAPAFQGDIANVSRTPPETTPPLAASPETQTPEAKPSGLNDFQYPLYRVASQTIEKPAWAVTELTLKGLNGFFKYAPAMQVDFGLAKGIKENVSGFLDKAIEYYSNPEENAVFTPPADAKRAELRQAAYQRNYALGIAGDVSESVTDLMAFMLGAELSGVSKASESASGVGKIVEGASKMAAYGFTTTSGDMSDRAKSALFLIGYGMTPYIANATGATGLNAVAVNAMLNAFVSTPSYLKSLNQSGGVNKNFLAMAVPQFIMDVGFAWHTRGTPENQYKARLKKYLKNRPAETQVTEKEAENVIDTMKQVLNDPASLQKNENEQTLLENSKTNLLVSKVVEAINAANPVRGEQEKLYSQERGRRIAKALAVGSRVRGEKGFYAELSQLKGELPKNEFESIRNEFTQENIDDLFNMIKDFPGVGEFEKITARTGLAKILGEYGGKVPTKGEIFLLNKVFGDEFTKALLNKRTGMEKFLEGVHQVANLPRSLMSSFDLSAPFRQGIFFIGRPKQFFGAFKEMFGVFGSEKAFKALQESFAKDPMGKFAYESKLALTDLGHILGEREEAFMSNWADKIPIVGSIVKASGRAYVGFLNKLRFDVFKDLYTKAEGLGLNPSTEPKLTNSIANFINNATGRGSLGRFASASNVLSDLFFSPRLIASRFNLLRPDFYMKQEPFVRKEALKSLFSFVGFGSAVLTLSSFLPGVKVGLDPRSSDFGKIRIGNTRVDVWGGFSQIIVGLSRVVSGKYVSSTSGREMTLGEGYKPMTRFDIIQKFLESKLSPAASFVLAILKQQTPTGEQVKIQDEVVTRFIPMIIQDTIDLGKENPALLPLGLLGALGVGVQTYGKNTGRKSNADY